MASTPRYVTKLRGSRVLIVGGSSGIGFGVAQALLEFGASVIISSSSPEHVQDAVQRLRALRLNSSQTEIQGIRCDLGTLDTLGKEVGDLFSEVGKIGKLDHVVFTAGDALAIKELEEFSLFDIQKAGTVRFFAPLLIAQKLRRNLNASVASSFTVSTGGIPEHLLRNWAVVQSYLSGIHGMVRGLAVDLAPIRVNAVGLGPVDTELWNDSREAGTFDQIRAAFEAKMTTRSMGRVEDVVEAYLYAMKDHNLSGATVVSHGGTLLL